MVFVHALSSLLLLLLAVFAFYLYFKLEVHSGFSKKLFAISGLLLSGLFVLDIFWVGLIISDYVYPAELVLVIYKATQVFTLISLGLTYKLIKNDHSVMKLEKEFINKVRKFFSKNL